MNGHHSRRLLIDRGGCPALWPTDQVHAGPGDTVLAPRGVPHSQRRAVPRTGRFLEIYAPAGSEGFFRELADAESSGASMDEVYRSVSDKYGITWG